jgi:ribosome-binding factor A
MSSRRTLKAAEAIREVVSMAILVDLKDPRIRDVTVTFVEVAADMRQAKVHVSVMGDEARQRLSVIGLQNSAGFLQQKIGTRLDTRYTPRLTFVLDKGIKNAMMVTRILNEVLPKERAEQEADDHDDSDPTSWDADSNGGSVSPRHREPPNAETRHQADPDQESG